MESKLHIGIDPDCDRSGFSVYRVGERKITHLECLDLIDLMDRIRLLHQGINIKVYLEAGWLLKATWHKGGVGMAKRVGSNHEIGRQLEKFLIKESIPYQLILPQGYSSFTHDRFCKITGWPANVKTNSEKRVAGMLVYGR